MTREADILYENGPVWVYRDKRAYCYTVYLNGATHSTGDSAYPRTADGLSLAIARTDYLARRIAFRRPPSPPRAAPKRP